MHRPQSCQKGSRGAVDAYWLNKKRFPPQAKDVDSPVSVFTWIFMASGVEVLLPWQMEGAAPVIELCG